ncbi:hypothetical protein KVT40_004602 [Elsinoe batatas]|uniref:C2H2-type domain-containing protein n=1 Tax=Elsinoe batatas TaxID=2601811 RepID=A0A8K0PIX3_9PEZI|nr:hypothetical protein KVT40_004602 [Elsinoe batatas]
MQFQGLDEADQLSGDLFLPEPPAWLEEGSQSQGYDGRQQMETTTTWSNDWMGTTASDTSAHLTSISPSAHPLQSSREPSWWSPVTSHALGGHSVTVPGISLSVTRTLPRRRSKYTLRRSRSGRAVAIPKAQTSQDDQQPLPMQRWRNSPPEDEPTPFAAIANSISQIHPRSHDRARNISDQSSPRSSPHDRGPSSAASLENDASSTSTQSARSFDSARSGRSARSSKAKASAGQSRRKADASISRTFQCTFCCDTFRTRYDWTRHEKSLHLALADWQCAPPDGIVATPTTGQPRCIYCHSFETGAGHLSSHGHYACRLGSAPPPTFKRRDHLFQHLRLVHHIENVPCKDDWKATAPMISSRCGFCDMRLSTWDERCEHLSAHFRQGKTMADWQGDHDFEPHIEACILHALPPYLIASEAKSLVPYSATSTESRDHMKQIYSQIETLSGSTGSPNIAATYSNHTTDVPTPEEMTAVDTPPPSQRTFRPESLAFADRLALHLSRYARQQVANGVMPSDAMFQQEARRAMYDDDDDWNQTIADNAFWLERFRLNGGWDGSGA